MQILNDSAAQTAGIDFQLTHSVQRFLFEEADILDRHDFHAWLGLLTDDVTYEVVLPVTRLTRKATVSVESDTKLYDEDKGSLALRIKRFGTGAAWADDPPSRSRRIIGNVYVLEGDPSSEVLVRSNIILYRNRIDRDMSLWVASRTDRLVPAAGSWQIRARKVVLEDATIHTKHLTTFL